MEIPLAPIKKRIIIILSGLLLFWQSPAFSFPPPEALKKSHDYKTISANALKEIPLPKGYHEGLYLNGADMWVINGEKGKIWVVDTVSGKTTSTIEPIAGFTEAISRKSDNLFFVTDWDEKKIYRARLDDNKFTVEYSVSVAPAHPAGALWTGERLYVIAWTRGMGTKFDLLEMDGEMTLLRKISIQAIQEPAHLAWDGKNLWITGWYDSLVYKVDLNNLEITGDFLAPMPRATGIAWDGKYFWITGTFSDLYRVEVGG